MRWMGIDSSPSRRAPVSRSLACESDRPPFLSLSPSVETLGRGAMLQSSDSTLLEKKGNWPPVRSGAAGRAHVDGQVVSCERTVAYSCRGVGHVSLSLSVPIAQHASSGRGLGWRWYVCPVSMGTAPRKGAMVTVFRTSSPHSRHATRPGRHATPTEHVTRRSTRRIWRGLDGAETRHGQDGRRCNPPIERKHGGAGKKAVGEGADWVVGIESHVRQDGEVGRSEAVWAIDTLDDRYSTDSDHLSGTAS
nr:hypothetical protein CFP56_20230 [Quercus suber]